MKPRRDASLLRPSVQIYTQRTQQAGVPTFMPGKTFLTKDGAKVLVATVIGLALIFGLATDSLKLRENLKLHDKPPHWMVQSESYGFGLPFRFGKSIEFIENGCYATCGASAIQYNNFGPIYYKRKLYGEYSYMLLDRRKTDIPNRDELFAELN